MLRKKEGDLYPKQIIAIEGVRFQHVIQLLEIDEDNPVLYWQDWVKTLSGLELAAARLLNVRTSIEQEEERVFTLSQTMERLAAWSLHIKL